MAYQEVTVDVYNASAEYGTDVAENTGDSDDSTFWTPGSKFNGTQWVSFDFGEAHTISKIEVWSKADAADGVRLKDFTLQYSDNDSDWDTQEAFQHTSSDGNEEFVVASPSSHRYWRALCSSQWNSDSSWGRIHEFHLFETTGGVATGFMTTNTGYWGP